MDQKLKELRAEISAKTSSLTEDVKAARKLSGAEGQAAVAGIKAANTELEDLRKKAAPLEETEAALVKAERFGAEAEEVEAHPGHAKGAVSPEAQFKSIGEYVSEAGLAGKKSQDVEIAMDVEGRNVKTLFQTSAGWEPENVRSGRLVESAQLPVQAVDVIPAGTASEGAVTYMKEVTFTNGAAAIKEGGAYSESALKVEEAQSGVKKIGTFLPITDEQLEDVNQAQSYINNRLPLMVRLKLDKEVLAGNGEEGAIKGFLSESVQEQAKGEDSVAAAILKALTKVRTGTGQANPTAVLVNPADWQQVRLETTEDGVYIWGPPSQVGPEVIWGVPVIQVQALTEGTALTGDFSTFSELAFKKGLNVQVSNSHEDYFVKGKQAIRADVRAALVIYRPAAFVKVTGI